MASFRLFVACALVPAMPSCCCVVAPPEVRTSAYLARLSRVSLYYVNDNSVLPRALADIDGLASADSYDAWGRLLLVSSPDDHTLTITSLGADGMPGGLGPSQDLRVRLEEHGNEVVVVKETREGSEWIPQSSTRNTIPYRPAGPGIPPGLR